MLCKTCPQRNTCKSPCPDLEDELRMVAAAPKWDEICFSPSKLTRMIDAGVTGSLWEGRSDTDALVEQAVELLPPQQRQVIRLRYWHDLNEATIAEILKLSRGTVARYLVRGREKLQEILSRSFYPQNKREGQPVAKTNSLYDNKIA